MRVLSGLGFLVWAAALLGWLVSGRVATRGASPEAASALEDELVRLNRSKAFTAGYIVALLVSGVVFGISLFQPMSGMEAAHLILVLTIVAPVYAFVFLERGDSDDKVDA